MIEGVSSLCAAAVVGAVACADSAGSHCCPILLLAYSIDWSACRRLHNCYLCAGGGGGSGASCGDVATLVASLTNCECKVWIRVNILF